MLNKSKISATLICHDSATNCCVSLHLRRSLFTTLTSARFMKSKMLYNSTKTDKRFTLHIKADLQSSQMQTATTHSTNQYRARDLFVMKHSKLKLKLFSIIF